MSEPLLYNGGIINNAVIDVLVLPPDCSGVTIANCVILNVDRTRYEECISKRPVVKPDQLFEVL